MGYEDIVRVNLSYLEARFLCSFLVEKHEDLMQLEKTAANKELIHLVKKSHNKIMKKLEDD